MKAHWAEVVKNMEEKFDIDLKNDWHANYFPLLFQVSPHALTAFSVSDSALSMWKNMRGVPRRRPRSAIPPRRCPCSSPRAGIAGRVSSYQHKSLAANFSACGCGWDLAHREDAVLA